MRHRLPQMSPDSCVESKGRRVSVGGRGGAEEGEGLEDKEGLDKEFGRGNAWSEDAEGVAWSQAISGTPPPPPPPEVWGTPPPESRAAAAAAALAGGRDQLPPLPPAGTPWQPPGRPPPPPPPPQQQRAAAPLVVKVGPGVPYPAGSGAGCAVQPAAEYPERWRPLRWLFFQEKEDMKKRMDPFFRVMIQGAQADPWVEVARWRGCHSAAPPSTFSRCINSDGERASAK